MAKLPNVPSDNNEQDTLPVGPVARSQGPADQNESVTNEDRSGKPKSPMSDGPNLLDKTGAYGPARYTVPPQEIVTRDGRVQIISGIVREDR